MTDFQPDAPREVLPSELLENAQQTWLSMSEEDWSRLVAAHAAWRDQQDTGRELLSTAGREVWYDPETRTFSNQPPC